MTSASKILDAAALQAALSLSDAVMARIEAHRATLAEWNTRMNLVGPREMEHYWGRHALDSLQLLQHVPAARRWIDLGAGAGFPGALIACALADEPGADVALIESIGKKAAFLRAAAEATGAPIRVLNERVETALKREKRCDVVTARAFAPLPRIIEYVSPLLDRGAIGLFPKGESVERELADAAARWDLDVEILPSMSDPRGRLLRVRGARRRTS